MARSAKCLDNTPLETLATEAMSMRKVVRPIVRTITAGRYLEDMAILRRTSSAENEGVKKGNLKE